MTAAGDVLPEEMSAAIRVEGCVSPAHVDFEVGSALVRLERRGELGEGSARILIETFSVHPVDEIPRIRVCGVIQDAYCLNIGP